MSETDNTPVIVGVGQVTEHLDDPNFTGHSPCALAALATEQALQGAANSAAWREQIDSIAFIRTFGDSVPESLKALLAPFGGSDNPPRSVAARIQCAPRHAILSKACGDEPQRLVAELCRQVASGEVRAGVVCGAEAIATQRAIQQTGSPPPDWNESPGGDLDDRGQGIDLLFDPELARHGAVAPVDIYPLFEHARRHRLNQTRAAYRSSMASLFAKFAAVAAANPLAMSRRALTANDIGLESSDNRLIADPYLKHMVARDRVNQGAAVLVTSLATARQFGLDDRAIFLHGHAEAQELPTLERADLSCSPAMTWAYENALSAVGISSEAIDAFDLYSCFPIAVFAALDALGIQAEDARPLTLTGGLPFFGGPGNNYSLHAIASAVEHCRKAPTHKVLVGANGGYLSKHAVGIYSSQPGPLVMAEHEYLARNGVSALTAPASGAGKVETFTIKPGRNGADTIIVIGRMLSSGERFVANVAPNDVVTREQFRAGDPIGREAQVTGTAERNTLSLIVND